MLVNQPSAWFSRLLLFALILILNLFVPRYAFAEEVTINVTDQVTNTPVANSQITVYRFDESGSRKWFTRESTNEQGQVVFDLPEITSGTPYQLSSNAFNNTKLYSEVISNGTNFDFPLGTKSVLLKDGSNTDVPVLIEREVTLKRIKDDGRLEWVTKAITDGQGIARFNVANDDSQYVYSAKSATGDTKYSEPSSAQGATEFVVGNPPVNVHLVHGITGGFISNQRVWVKEILSNGEQQYITRKDSDENGRVVFDLDGLENGRQYMLYSEDENKFRANQLVTQAGDMRFEFGNTQLTILNGRIAGNPILPETSVTIYRETNDNKEWITRVKSTATGQVLLDLEQLQSGQQYIAKVKVEGKNYEAAIPAQGEQALVFGKLPQWINVTLNNTATNQPIVGQRVNLKRWEGDRRKFVARADTDQNGQVQFDAQGLYEQQVMFVELSVFDGEVTRSDNITSPTDINFDLHMVEGGFQIQLNNGTTPEPQAISASRVDIYKVEGEEKSWFTRRDTDENGLVNFTLPGMDTSQAYIARARHPVINKYVYSEPLTSNGLHTFTVGYQPLEITLVNPFDNSPIVGARLDVMRLKEDGNLRREARQTTDDSGRAVFHLEQISTDTPAILKAQSVENFRAEMQLDTTGAHQFPLGNTQLTLLNGREETQPVLAETRVKIYKVLGEQRERVAYGDSNSQGKILFELPQLSSEEVYLAELRIDNKTYRSEFNANQDNQVVFGRLPQWLNVSVNNTRTNSPVTNLRLDVYDVTDGQRRHTARGNTDETGFAQFDLQGLYENKAYQVELRPFDGEKVKSEIIDVASDLAFDLYLYEDGLPIQVLNGNEAGQPPYVDTRIDIYRNNEEGMSWYSRQNTDENGFIHVRLPQMDQGQEYVLAARTALNNIKRYSQPIVNQENQQFVVGNAPVNVSLIHGVTREPITQLRVNALRLDEEGKFRYYQRNDTNEQGIASFDLEGLDSGAQYRFKVDFLDSGSSYSVPITTTQNLDFIIGNVPVTLQDRDSGNTIAATRVDAYWLDENNRMRRERRGNTDAEGDILFDLARLQEGTRYVLKAKNPFGENKTYYGPIIYQEGAVQFIVKKGEYGELDLEDPEVFITSPTRTEVNADGFTVTGFANDDNSISRVHVTVIDPIKGQQSADASLNSNNQWQFDIESALLSANQTVTIVATAYDAALNSASTETQFNVIEDAEAPQITVTSHSNDDSVNETGFTLLGTASDDTGIVNILASVIDPVLGTTISQQSVNVAQSGQWAFIVTNGKVSGGETIEIQLQAFDSSNKQASAALNLQVQTIIPQQTQLISRITFGMTPELYLNQPSAEVFLQQQLNPESIDDGETEQQAASWVLQEIDDLKALQLNQMLNSNRQLNEVMTWFWENHFNTHFNTHQSLTFEVMENRAFRANALGRFRDILAISAKSPAMIYYLNNAQNVVGNANENYAREIMELHTLGVDGGYTAEDIAELSRIFTGWHEQTGEFFFNQEQHDFGDKTFLGETILGEGLAEGERVLDILASHPSTARNLCRKFIALFVSDEPVNSLQGQCEAEYLQSDGNIAAVLNVIFASDAFVALANQKNKTKTPLEMTIAAIRSVNAEPDYPALINTLNRMGYSLFQYPVPTGLAEDSSSWLTSDALLQRIRFANRFALYGEEGASVDLQSLMLAMGYSSPEAIVGLIADLALNGQLSDLERDIALEILNENLAANEAFDINAFDAEEKLQRLLGTMLSFPAFQYQ